MVEKKAKGKYTTNQRRKRWQALWWLAHAVNNENHGEGCLCKECVDARFVLQKGPRC